MTIQTIRQYKNIWLIDKPNYTGVPVVNLTEAVAMIRYYWGKGTQIQVQYRSWFQKLLHTREARKIPA